MKIKHRYLWLDRITALGCVHASSRAQRNKTRAQANPKEKLIVLYGMWGTVLMSVMTIYYIGYGLGRYPLLGH